MLKKLLFVLSLMTVIAAGCTKSTTADSPTGGGEGGDNPSPSGNGGVYSETFAGYNGKVDSGYLAQESFTSTATGVTWTLDFGKIDQTEDHEEFYGEHCFTMGGNSGKADNGQSVITTSTLTDGIIHLEFDYVANKNKQLEVQVLVGGNVVWTSGTMSLENNGQSDTKVLEHKSFTITGATSNAVLKFINVSKARRISIGNITWTNATGEGGNGYVFDEGGQGGDEGDGDITMTAKSALAEYYGDYYETNTQDWVLTLENTTTSESICVEFLNTANSKDIVGTYTIDATESYANGTALTGILDDEDYLYPTFYFNENTMDYGLATEGSAVITKSGSTYTINVNFTDETGRKISCNYTGAVTIQEGELYDDDEGDDDEGDDDDDSNTTLTSNVTISNITYAEAYYYGDYFETGTNDWQFYIGNDDEMLGFELFTNLTATSPVGTYTVDLSYTGEAGTVWDGYDYGGYSMPAYYNYTTGDYAFPDNGTITISQGAGSNYTITVEAYDENGYKISVNYTGEMTIAEGEFSDDDEDYYALAKPANAQKALKKANKVAGKALIKSVKAQKGTKKFVKNAKSVKNTKAIKAKRAHKTKAIRLAK